MAKGPGQQQEAVIYPGTPSGQGTQIQQGLYDLVNNLSSRLDSFQNEYGLTDSSNRFLGIGNVVRDSGFGGKGGGASITPADPTPGDALPPQPQYEPPPTIQSPGMYGGGPYQRSMPYMGGYGGSPWGGGYSGGWGGGGGYGMSRYGMGGWGGSPWGGYGGYGGYYW